MREKIALPPKYSKLCAATEKHDPKAAKWMREKIPNLPSFLKGVGSVRKTDASSICDAFLWEEARQKGLNANWNQLDDLVGCIKRISRPKKRSKRLAKWEERKISIPSKATRPILVELVAELVAEINQLGVENVRLKNRAKTSK